jgi:hypothetical protein
MNQSRLYIVGIAAFVLGGFAGGYLGPRLSRGDGVLRNTVQRLNQLPNLVAGHPIAAPSIGWVNPPELDRPVLWTIYALVPPLVVAAILGAWTKTIFGFIGPRGPRLKQLLFLTPIDFKPKPTKAGNKF